MLLSDVDLKKLAQEEHLVDPFLKDNYEGATVNLTLHNEIKVFISTEEHIIGSEIDEKDYEKIDISKEEFFLRPRKSILVQSLEYFKIPDNMAGIVFERYSVK